MSITSTGSSLTQSSYPNQGLIVMGTGPESGINYSAILKALDQALSAPITLMQAQETPLNNQLSAWQSIGSDISALSSSASALGQPSLFQSFTATSSDTSVATAQASSSAIPGTYNVTVSSLATTGVIASQGVAATSTAVASSGSTGTFNITVNGNTTDVALNSTTGYTLADLAQTINNSNAGVTASIINNGATSDPYQLVLTSNNTGTNYAPSVTDNLTGGTSLTFTTTQSAANAKLSYEGISITSQSNTVKNVIPGVTLSLASTGSTTITVGLDTQTIDNAVSSFISAYNKVIGDVSAQNTVTSSGSGNTKSETLGPLGGNVSLTNLVNNLYSFIGSEAPGLSGNAGLASTYGITQSSSGSGKLQLNASALNNMLTSDPQQVQQYLSALVNGSPSADGASQPGGMTNFLNTYTNSANGVVQFSEAQINTQLTNMNNQIAQMQANVQTQMGMYTKEFSNLESYIGQMQTTNSALTSSIKQMIAQGA
ncbi:MAG: flagellar filament capping protein FliD [bacterium]